MPNLGHLIYTLCPFFRENLIKLGLEVSPDLQLNQEVHPHLKIDQEIPPDLQLDQEFPLNLLLLQELCPDKYEIL